MQFRKQAVDKEDRLQQAIISRHLSKCDEQLISLERWSDFWQEKLTMWAGRLLSSHGSLWLRPLLWVLGLNMCFSLLIHAVVYGVCYLVISICLAILFAYVLRRKLGSWLIKYRGFLRKKLGSWLIKNKGFLRKKLENYLIFSSFFVVVVYLLLMLVNYDEWRILLSISTDLFNPLTKTVELSKIISNGGVAEIHAGWKYSIIGLILIISKALYAACGYEFVRAARQFTYR